jgi:hypothetical protein
MCFYIVKKGLGKKDKKRWHYDEILVHLKKIAPKKEGFVFGHQFS